MLRAMEAVCAFADGDSGSTLFGAVDDGNGVVRAEQRVRRPIDAVTTGWTAGCRHALQSNPTSSPLTASLRRWCSSRWSPLP